MTIKTTFIATVEWLLGSGVVLAAAIVLYLALIVLCITLAVLEIS